MSIAHSFLSSHCSIYLSIVITAEISARDGSVANRITLSCILRICRHIWVPFAHRAVRKLLKFYAVKDADGEVIDYDVEDESARSSLQQSLAELVHGYEDAKKALADVERQFQSPSTNAGNPQLRRKTDNARYVLFGEPLRDSFSIAYSRS